MGKARLQFENIKPCVFAYYHGQMFVLMALSPRSRVTTLASNSRDGEMIARAADRMGFGLARGSKNQGGVKAGLELMTAAETDRSILFNVDGPRGPKHIVKESIIRVAQISGLPIVPVVCDARSKVLMNSWDNYMIPMLNTKTVYIFADPIHVGQNLSDDEKEALRLQLEDCLARINSRLPEFWTI
jgi:hypothetical protein